MENILKRAAGRVLIPFAKWYLRKRRKFTYESTEVHVDPGVFHPGFFSSTIYILGFLKDKDLKNKSVLELGCGTGLISIQCAKGGAIVTAIDISRKAIQNATENVISNQVEVTLILSDLFANIPTKPFDWIIINPPYYARRADNEAEFAWNCGENFEYFRMLFTQLPAYMHSDTFLLMVLTKGCDLETIFEIAKGSGFSFQKIQEKKVLFDEKDYLFRITFNSFESVQA